METKTTQENSEAGAGLAAATGSADYPPPWAYELWEHMSHEHGLTLLESELHEIIYYAKRVEVAEYTRRAIEASKAICCHLGEGYKEDPQVTRYVLSVVGMEFPNVPVGHRPLRTKKGDE